MLKHVAWVLNLLCVRFVYGLVLVVRLVLFRMRVSTCVGFSFAGVLYLKVCGAKWFCGH